MPLYMSVEERCTGMGRLAESLGGCICFGPAVRLTGVSVRWLDVVVHNMASAVSARMVLVLMGRSALFSDCGDVGRPVWVRFAAHDAFSVAGD